MPELQDAFEPAQVARQRLREDRKSVSFLVEHATGVVQVGNMGDAVSGLAGCWGRFWLYDCTNSRQVTKVWDR